MSADHDLLFGLLALQNGLIDQVQLVSAFQARTRDRGISLSNHLVMRGDLDDEGRIALDALVSLYLRKSGEGCEHGASSLTPDRHLSHNLTLLNDPELTASLARFQTGSPQSNGDQRVRFPGVGDAGQRFRVLRPHARGGLGVVFVALDGELNREVAFKQILDDYADNPQSRLRFLQEAEITGGLEHPGIVPVYGLGTCVDGRPYYAMRLIRGETLKDAIARHHDKSPTAKSAGNFLELRKLLRSFIDACNAVEYAHSRGVLHRDIKPSNVIVGKHGETLVIDWGLAKVVSRKPTTELREEQTLVPSTATSSSQTLAGSAMGTPAYMSPEQAAGQLDLLGPPSDVYSLGATLYCLLTGQAPFEGNDLEGILKRVAHGQFSPPKTLRPRLPLALDAICRKAMALRPYDRYDSPRTLADDIELWLADEPIGAWAEPVWTRSARWARRNKLIVAMAAAILVTTSLALAIGTRLIAIERDEAMKERNEARRQKQEAQIERDRAVNFSIQVESKELQLRDAYASNLLHLNESKSAFLLALTGLHSREGLIRLHPSNIELKQDRIDSFILCARIMGSLDTESLKWSVEWIERREDTYPKTPKLALIQTRDACVEFARNNSADPWRKVWCVERLWETAKLQREYGFASDSLESYLLCHDSYVAMESRFTRFKGMVPYNDACIQAQCAGLLAMMPPSAKQAAEHDRFANGATIALKRAIEAGFDDIKQLQSDSDLNPIRSRPEFQAMIDDLVFPSNPFAR
jgi:serine/threonine protein kinase